MQSGVLHLISFFAVLIFLRVNAVFALSLDEFQATVIGRGPSHVLDAFVRVISISVEVVLFSLATHWLERAVSLTPFFRLECLLTTCHVARRFGSPQLVSLGGGGSGSGVLPRRQQQR